MIKFAIIQDFKYFYNLKSFNVETNELQKKIKKVHPQHLNS